MKYDIFISYRRQGGYEVAKHLYDLLKTDGYKVSFDMDTLQHGNFDTELLNRVDQCKDFVLILNQGVFDRCFTTSKNDDWLRCELSYALEKGKNIIPVMLEGFSEFPKNLPEDIVDVAMKNGPKYDKYYFDNFYQRLKDKFLLTTAHKQKHKNRLMTGIGSAIVIIVVATFFLWKATPQETGNNPEPPIDDVVLLPDTIKDPVIVLPQEPKIEPEPKKKEAETPKPAKKKPFEALFNATDTNETPNGNSVSLKFERGVAVRFVLTNKDTTDVNIKKDDVLEGNWKNGIFSGNGTLYKNDGSITDNIQDIILK